MSYLAGTPRHGLCFTGTDLTRKYSKILIVIHECTLIPRLYLTHNTLDYMTDLFFALSRHIVIKQKKGRSSVEGVSNEELSAWLIHKTKVKSLKLQPHTRNPRGATGNRFVQQTHQWFVVGFHNDMLAVYILPKSEEPELDSQQLLLNFTIPFVLELKL